MNKKIVAKDVAAQFRSNIRERIAQLPRPPRLVGFLATDKPDSEEYAGYTKSSCEDVGIEFVLTKLDRFALESAIVEASASPDVHGIIVYYPIFNSSHDSYLRGLVPPHKDVEGLNQHWLRMLYSNERYDDPAKTKKAILPCTPLAIVKLIEASGYFSSELSPETRPLEGKVVTIFNRSEVVGRPLAFMVANDGAKVFSYDIDGLMIFDGSSVKAAEVPRAVALAQSDIVITGVPSEAFTQITPDEIKSGALCINFSMSKNFGPGIEAKAGCFIPRVGPMTIAMCLRNTLRLYENYCL